MLHATGKVSGSVLWANLHLLFWLSLLPFATGWMGENHFSALPEAIYGVVLLMAALAYWMLARAIIATDGRDALLAKAIGRDRKGNLSIVLYAVAIPLAFVASWLAIAIYVLVALMWVIPDQRIEKIMPESH